MIEFYISLLVGALLIFENSFAIGYYNGFLKAWRVIESEQRQMPLVNARKRMFLSRSIPPLVGGRTGQLRIEILEVLRGRSTDKN